MRAHSNIAKARCAASFLEDPGLTWCAGVLRFCIISDARSKSSEPCAGLSVGLHEI
jgi:hypothetical protein